MSERLLILIALAGFSLSAYRLWQSWQGRRVHRLQNQPVSPLLHALNLPAKPTILYFTTSSCAQCRFQQSPILRQLQAQWGDAVHIRKLDAVQHDAVSHHFGIMTTPSTVILDAEHQVVAINHGLAPAARLQEQMQTLRSRARQTRPLSPAASSPPSPHNILVSSSRRIS